MVPALFLAHGSPMIAIEDSEYTQFLTALGKKISPKAIIVFTAHWESDVLTISSTNNTYDTIYDFHGFSKELYAITYPAKGSVKIAAQVAERFKSQGIEVKLDSKRGLDHGVWTLLHHVHPKADIPVIQVSVNPLLSTMEQIHIGSALKGLGVDDILIIGSGATVHNLSLLKWGQKDPEQWAVDFDDWLINKLQAHDLDALNNYKEQAPYANQAIPRAEHFVPLMIAFGSGMNEKVEVIHRSYDFGTLSYLCMQF